MPEKTDTHDDLLWGITTIDTGFVRPGFTASHLIVERDEAAFVDVGPTTHCQALLDTLRRKQIASEQVRYVIVTHVHLDHAGSAGTLLPHFPNAQVVVHPKGARHLINPEKLLAGATAVYGEKKLNTLFGEMVPVPQGRILQPEDDSVLDLAGRSLLIRHTNGHARHHICIIDERSRGIFTGDTFGLSFREFDTKHGHFIFPATAPVQFEPDAMQASIRLLMDYQPENLYLTHFGQVTNVPQLAERLHRIIERSVNIARSVATDGEERHQELRRHIEHMIFSELAAHECPLSPERILDLLGSDLTLNIMGLEVWLDRLKKRQKTP
jgi:glyoxylase-like metal-dependent hydrolase (beta-lactamase superfamily II)